MKHALIAAIVMATPATAQDRMTPEHCNDSWAALESLVGENLSDRPFAPDNEGWCQISDGVFRIDDVTRIRVDSLRWRASDIDRFIEGNLPPRSIEVQGQGFGVVPETGDPVSDYLLGVQMAQADTSFGLSVRWDGVQNAVVVDELFVSMFGENRIEATARVEGVNLTDQTSMQMSIGSMGLQEMNIQSDFAGWFESYVSFGLGYALLKNGEVSPQDQVGHLQQQAVEFIEGIPEANMSEGSRTALSEFVMDLPNPRGRAQLQLIATPPLGAARMAPLAVLASPPTPEQIVELGLEGAIVSYSWAPTGGAE